MKGFRITHVVSWEDWSEIQMLSHRLGPGRVPTPVLRIEPAKLIDGRWCWLHQVRKWDGRVVRCWLPERKPVEVLVARKAEPLPAPDPERDDGVDWQKPLSGSSGVRVLLSSDGGAR